MKFRISRLIAILIGFGISMHANAAGLLAPTDLTLPPLRVTEHSVEVKIHDQIALTTLDQTFHNDTSRRLEATYVFPLPENADLTDFQMTFNGKMVKGEVLPAEQARQVYESIVRQSRDPGLIEFIGRRLLQMRVFPIEPNSDTKIEVKYQQICKPVSGMSAYHYPLRTTKTSGQSYGMVRFNVLVETSAPLKNVWSPTHSVEIVRDGEHVAKIAYEASKGSLEDDFLLLYDTDASDLGLSVVAYKPSEGKPGHFVLTLTPKQLWPKQEYQPQDVVFVIDTSGSMAGEKIDQARAALKYCVDQLDERDRFDVVRFSTGVDTLFERMQPATRDNRDKAKEKIQQFSAAGGTNISDALKVALDLKPMSGSGVREDAGDQGGKNGTRPFVVVFVTDGLGNQPAEETLAMVNKHPGAANARIFTFGVGHDVNTVFLDQLATNHHAKPTYVQPGENLELTLGDFFAVISQPVLTNLKLTLPEIGAAEKFPAALGDLYHGQQLILAGKFEDAKTGPVKLTAIRNGEQVEYEWPNVSFTHTAEAKYVPSIWAGRKIAFLIDEIRAHGESKEMVDEVIALSQEYGIQTPYTSWLVNPDQPIMIGHRMVMPAPASNGFGGGGRSAFRDSRSKELLERSGTVVRDLQNPAAPAVNMPADGLHAESGQSAFDLAKENAHLREQKSKDEGARADESTFAIRKIGDRWYNRIGQYLVDQDFSEKSQVTSVRFGSPAYFEIVNRCPELRAALATSRNIVVITAPNQAIVISEDTGIEEFSPDQLKQTGLADRT